MTLSGCLSRGSGGHACCVVCVMYASVEEAYIILGFGSCERWLRGAVKRRGPCGAGKAV